VTTVLEDVSKDDMSVSGPQTSLHYIAKRIPLHRAPQISQVRIAFSEPWSFSFPALVSSRLPQSRQKTREPIADIVVMYCREVGDRRESCRKKVTGKREICGESSAAASCKRKAASRVTSTHACASTFTKLRRSSSASPGNSAHHLHEGVKGRLPGRCALTGRHSARSNIAQGKPQPAPAPPPRSSTPREFATPQLHHVGKWRLAQCQRGRAAIPAGSYSR
jgi:hypothetical protein